MSRNLYLLNGAGTATPGIRRLSTVGALHPKNLRRDKNLVVKSGQTALLADERTEFVLVVRLLIISTLLIIFSLIPMWDRLAFALADAAPRTEINISRQSPVRSPGPISESTQSLIVMADSADGTVQIVAQVGGALTTGL